MTERIENVLDEILHSLLRIETLMTKQAEIRERITVSNDGHVQAVPRDQILAMYHKLLPRNPEIVVWNEARAKALRQRWKEHPNLDWWEQYFITVSSARWLVGQVDPQNGRTLFVADIDFLLRPSTVTKVTEGKYHRGSSHALRRV